MKKKIWIINHYATNMYFNEGGRHYWFAENLIKNGYEPTIFCANTRHNIDGSVDLNKDNYSMKKSKNIPFVFVKASDYSSNGIERLKNMVSFYKNLLGVAKDFSKKNGKPDIILASSVHPLTLVAGIKLAKKFNIPCISEVRDLWPESIVAYGALKKSNPIAKVLYRGEKWIYKKSDAIVMTWEGGKDYVEDQGWSNVIDTRKITHINNGVIIDSFDENSIKYEINDLDLDNNNFKNFVYAGSIRKVNNLGLLIDAAKLLQDRGRDDLKILIFGSGDELEKLKDKCDKENILNVVFKGRIEKKMVPSVLKKSYVNILHNSSTSLDKYGQSQNKFFEYLAAGKGIIQTYTTGYSICERDNCGITVSHQNAKEVAEAIEFACDNEDVVLSMGTNARNTSHEYDFKNLTLKLIDVIENVKLRGDLK